MKIGCRITFESCGVINENFKFLNKLKEIYLNSKSENKIDNHIGNAGCDAVFNNAKNLKIMEILNLSGNKGLK